MNAPQNRVPLFVEPLDSTRKSSGDELSTAATDDGDRSIDRYYASERPPI